MLSMQYLPEIFVIQYQRVSFVGANMFVLIILYFREQVLHTVCFGECKLENVSCETLLWTQIVTERSTPAMLYSTTKIIHPSLHLLSSVWEKNVWFLLVIKDVRYIIHNIIITVEVVRVKKDVGMDVYMIFFVGWSIFLLASFFIILRHHYIPLHYEEKIFPLVPLIFLRMLSPTLFGLQGEGGGAAVAHARTRAGTARTNGARPAALARSVMLQFLRTCARASRA